MRQKLNELLVVVKKELEKSKKVAEATHLDAASLSATANTSPSASGDRYHAEQQAVLNQERLENIENLYRLLQQHINEEKPSKVVIPCYLKAKVKGEIKEFYLVTNPVNLSGLPKQINLLSNQSPLAKQLMGKQVGKSGVLEIE